MLISFILIIVGFVLLLKGADYLVEGSVSVAKKLAISELVIGLTIVSLGTSAPELCVNIFAAITGNADIALGNVFGSNIANTLLVLGTCGLIAPLIINSSTVRFEIPFCILITIILAGMLNQGNILSLVEGLVLLCLLALFLFYTTKIAKEDKITDDLDDIPEDSIPKAVILVIIGAIGLTIGGKIIVDGAIGISKAFGVSQALIGLTVIALGTSLPELFASAVATYKGSKDIAIGNVIGSNIFNILLILGVSSSITPIKYMSFMNTDITIVAGSIVALFLFMFIGKKFILQKWQSGLMFVAYFVYIGYIVYRG